MTLNQLGSWQRGLMALACTALCSCNSLTQTTGGNGGLGGNATGGTTGGSSTGVQQTSSLAGQVSGSLINTSQKMAQISRAAGDSCAGTTFAIYEVGGQGTTVGQGSVNADGSFNANWTTTLAQTGDTPPEAVLVFNCATNATAALKCYGKPGDSTLVCDPVSNALITALEAALQAKVEASPLYKGLSVAKIAAGLVETLKLVSRLNPTNDYAAQLTAATTAAQIATILNGSPVGALFQSIQTLAAQAVAQNRTNATDPNGQRAALQAVWTVDKVVSMLAGTGLTLRLGIEGTGDDSELYGQLVDLVNTSTGTHIMTDLQRYVYSLYQDIYINKTNTQLTLLCSAQNYNSGYATTLVYPPDPNRTLDANGTRSLTCSGPTAIKLGVAAYHSDSAHPNCDPQDPNTCALDPNGTYISAALASAFQESDRNDPDGTHSSGSSLEIGIVDTLPEFSAAVQPGGVCGDVFNQVQDENNFINGEPNYAPLTPCLVRNNLGRYFAGVVGTYNFLTDPAVHDLRVSLDDIYTAMVDGMSMRMVAPFTDGEGNNYRTLHISDVLDSQGQPQTVSLPYVLFDTQPANGNNTVFQSLCPDALCDRGEVRATVTRAELQSVLNASRPGFHTLFGLMLHLPDLDTIRQWILQSAHYVNYNTAGSQFYGISGKDDDGDNVADRPILCKIYDPADPNTSLAQYHAGNNLRCKVALGNWVKGVEQTPAGNAVFKDYTRWFGLSMREQQGPDFYYALTDLYTGYEVTSDGQTFRIRDTSYYSGAAQDDEGDNVAEDGTTRYATDVESCYSYTDSSGNSTGVTQCYDSYFNYVALRFPNQNSPVKPSLPAVSFYPQTFYRPFSRSTLLTLNDPRYAGYSYQQYTDLAVAAPNYSDSDVDMSDSYTLCVARSGVTLAKGSVSVVTNVSLAGQVGDCTVGAHDTPVTPGSYYLALWYDPNNNVNDASDYKYQLIKSSDGTLMQASNCPNGSYCPVTVALSDLQTALGSKAPPLGPTIANAYIPSYNIQNPRYSPKYDPLCMDRDGNGRCDCYRDPTGTGDFSLHLTATSSPTDADCNLADNVGDEPTIAQSPTYDEPSYQSLAQVIDPVQGCGNRGGQVLTGCLIDKGIDLSYTYGINWNLVFTCLDPNKPLAYVNTDLLALPDPASSDPPADPNAIGSNCGPQGSAGPVFLNALSKRKNAYDIARPQTVLKLISTATQDAGTGVLIDRSDNLFTLNEANAMAFFRLAVPLTGLDLQQLSSSGHVTDYPNLIPTLQNVSAPWVNDTGAVPTAILRAFLEKSGSLTPSAK